MKCAAAIWILHHPNGKRIVDLVLNLSHNSVADRSHTNHFWETHQCVDLNFSVTFESEKSSKLRWCRNFQGSHQQDMRCGTHPLRTYTVVCGWRCPKSTGVDAESMPGTGGCGQGFCCREFRHPYTNKVHPAGNEQGLRISRGSITARWVREVTPSPLVRGAVAAVDECMSESCHEQLYLRGILVLPPAGWTTTSEILRRMRYSHFLPSYRVRVDWGSQWKRHVLWLWFTNQEQLEPWWRILKEMDVSFRRFTHVESWWPSFGRNLEKRIHRPGFHQYLPILLIVLVEVIHTLPSLHATHKCERYQGDLDHELSKLQSHIVQFLSTLSLTSMPDGLHVMEEDVVCVQTLTVLPVPAEDPVTA